MAEPSIHINYSFEDIQRYLQGKMSAAEMHELEKAALQDPFLADAIEGYTEVDINTAQQHLNEINTGLLSEKKKSKVVLFNRKTQWLRIAALIIVLTGIAVTAAYVFKNSNKHQQIAQLKKQEGSNNNAPVIKDSESIKSESQSAVVSNEKNVLTQNKIKKKKLSRTSAKKENNVSVSPGKNLQDDEASATTSIAAPAPVEQNEDASKSFAAASSSNKKNDSPQQILEGRVSGINLTAKTFTGKVLDENNKPVAGAVIESADKQKEVVTDINGNFALQKNDTLLNVTASTVGYETKNALLKENNINIIMLKENTAALNDVVVTGYGIKKNKATKQTAMPVGGWENFNNYVVSQLNKDTTKENFIPEKDIVEMEFLIDNSGNPYNIKIIKPLDDKRNSKAIDILKSGPKWTNTSKKNKKAKVAIAF